jgi:calcineurin-like phosphoesterase family protein
VKTFLTADWHLGETRLELLGRPFSSPDEMHRAFVREHNMLVAPDDQLFVVGDAVVDGDWLERIRDFHGVKTLLRGNYDRPYSDADLAPYFERIVPEGDGLELDAHGIPYYVTHYPTQGRQDRFNLVGHIHSSWKVQLNMLNVGVDVHHFLPLDLERVPFYFRAVNDFYDEDAWVAYDPINASYQGQRGKPGSYFTR